MDAGAGRAYLRVRVQFIYDLMSPVLDLSCLRVEAAIQVHTTQVVLWGEHEAYSLVAVLLAGSDGLLIVCPRLGVRATGPLSGGGGEGYLGEPAVALLGAPAQPLLQVSEVLGVCYHVYESSRCGERLRQAKPSPLPTPLEGEVREIHIVVIATVTGQLRNST